MRETDEDEEEELCRGARGGRFRVVCVHESVMVEDGEVGDEGVVGTILSEMNIVCFNTCATHNLREK